MVGAGVSNPALRSSVIISLGSVLLWYALSIGLTYYNRWLLKSYGFHYPLTLTMIHMAVNWTLCWIIRAIDEARTNRPRTVLGWKHMITKVGQQTSRAFGVGPIVLTH